MTTYPDGFVPDLRRLRSWPSLDNSLWRNPGLVRLTYGALARLIKRRIGTRPREVLYVGAGLGYIALELARAGHDIVGVDVDDGAVALATRASKTDPFADGAARSPTTSPSSRISSRARARMTASSEVCCSPRQVKRAGETSSGMPGASPASMRTHRSVLWHNPYDNSTELCNLTVSASGLVLEGTVLTPVGDEPARVEYRVDADEGANTRSARLRIYGPEWGRALELTRQGSRWLIDARYEPSLDDCTDVDLRVTPATNTLPIRRLRLPVGARAEVRAAWVGFPELQVLPSEQSYERLSRDAYRYRSGDFVADLHVDDAGLVLRYGDEYWRAVTAP